MKKSKIHQSKNSKQKNQLTPEEINKDLEKLWSILEQIDNIDFNKQIDIKSIDKEANELLEDISKRYKPLIDTLGDGE